MEEIKKESTGRGNVILLTVIAIVTMIIVVVGATFAYLASSVSSGDSANLNAVTEGSSDLLLINAGEDASIVANLENFYLGAGNLTANINADILLQTSSQSAVSYDYRVYLTVPHNDFEYSSGSCYVKPEGTVAADSAAACKEANATNIWATVDGSEYKCYGTSEAVANNFYSNQVACLSNSKYMWSASDTAELVLDLYRSTDEVVESDTCVNSGVCVNGARKIVGDLTSSSACTGANENNTWLPNIYEDGICYKVTTTSDLTTLTTEAETGLTLLDNVSITATNGGTRHYYKGIITLINFNHNQVVNGNKAFNGALHFTRVVPEEIQ